MLSLPRSREFLLKPCATAATLALGAAIVPAAIGGVSSVVILNPIADQQVVAGQAASGIALDGRYDDLAVTGITVRFGFGDSDFVVELFDRPGPGRVRTTPRTVENFLRYLQDGRYVNNMVHRSVPGFVIQAGGYNGVPPPDTSLFQAVPAFAPIQNEPGNSNAFGTVGMARIGGQPNSATSQWFINLANNGGTPPNGLDFVDGGFTVFGRVLENGMATVQAIAAIPRFNFDTPFGEVPLLGYTQADFNNEVPVAFANLVRLSPIGGVPELAFSATSSDPDLVTPSVIGSDLSLAVDPRGVGSAVISVRAQSVSGDFTVDEFVVVVQNRLDVNGDLVIDADDLADFINIYFAVPPDPRADFDGSGETNADDLAEFINAFFG